jgi:hypothetical protein
MPNESTNSAQTQLSGILSRFLKDIDSNPEEALPQSFAFLAFMASQPIPKVPKPPPDLEPFNINISEQIQEISNQYRTSLEKKSTQTARDKVAEKSASDIIVAMPDILKSRSNQEPSLSSDATFASIAERLFSRYTRN